MAILDKLMEKKDLQIYIKARQEDLKRILGENIHNIHPQHREMFRQRMLGRVAELDILRKLLSQNKLKRETIKAWDRNWRELTKVK